MAFCHQSVAKKNSACGKNYHKLYYWLVLLMFFMYVRELAGLPCNRCHHGVPNYLCVLLSIGTVRMLPNTVVPHDLVMQSKLYFSSFLSFPSGHKILQMLHRSNLWISRNTDTNTNFPVSNVKSKRGENR